MLREIEKFYGHISQEENIICATENRAGILGISWVCTHLNATCVYVHT